MVIRVNEQELKSLLQKDANISEMCLLIGIGTIPLVEMWNEPDNKASLMNDLQRSSSWQALSHILDTINLNNNNSNNNATNSNNNSKQYVKDDWIIPNSPLFLSGLQKIGGLAQEVYQLRNSIQQHNSNEVLEKKMKVGWFLMVGAEGSSSLPHFDGTYSIPYLPSSPSLSLSKLLLLIQSFFVFVFFVYLGGDSIILVLQGVKRVESRSDKIDVCCHPTPHYLPTNSTPSLRV